MNPLESRGGGKLQDTATLVTGVISIGKAAELAGEQRVDFEEPPAVWDQSVKEPGTELHNRQNLPHPRQTHWLAPASFASGIVLAVAAAIGLGILERDAGPVAPPAAAAAQQAAAVAPVVTPQATTRPLIMVVASQEDAARLRDAYTGDEMTALGEGHTLDLPPMSFFVVDSPEAERAYGGMLFELLLAETSTDVVDLR